MLAGGFMESRESGDPVDEGELVAGIVLILMFVLSAAAVAIVTL
jgi:hypothetical protein